jgi:murein DD-endopeptidase MepM/ murein hydrolase activator NlpD
MRKLARLCLVAVLIAGGLFALPRSSSRLFTADAQAQIVPTPSLPPILPGGGGGDDGDGEEEQPEEPTEPDEVIEEPKPSENEQGDGGTKPGKGDGKPGKGTGGRGGAPGGNTFVGGDAHIAGSFSTDRLVAAAARLRALGLPAEKVVAQVFAPFIIGGEAAWTDTWGAPRYGPGPLVRTHEGQDVFCRYGDPILAPEAGTVSYSDGGLGGITARVHASSTDYWYLTHLSATNAVEIPAGSAVEPGDIVGFCGNSGNAATTPPHVHFGHYVDGVAVNPMRDLVRWVREAERRVLGIVVKEQKRVVRTSDARTTERLFGDAFAPDLAEIDISGESLLASGSSPATGAFAVAETALQAALAEALEGSSIGSSGGVVADAHLHGKEEEGVVEGAPIPSHEEGD